MKTIRFFLSQLLICFIFLSHTLFASQLTNYLFDLGTSTSPVEDGFTPITEHDLYSAGFGYGWIKKPDRSFDDLTMKPANDLLCDGIVADENLIYRIDVPAGDYFLTVSLGVSGSNIGKVLISVNGITISDTIFIPWLRLNYRTIRKKITLESPNMVLEIHSRTSAVSIRAIELRPVTDLQFISFGSELASDTAQVSEFACQLRMQLSANPSNLTVQNQLNILEKYLLANYYYDIGWWSWAVEQTGLSIFNRLHIASDLLRQVIADSNDPLYYKSAFLLGKIHYWLYQEQHNIYDRNEAEKFFSLVRGKYPEHELLRMYSGEKILHACPCDINNSSAPEWAKKQHQAITRMLELIHWWIDQRQAENGEMGGKFGDDVEMLRWWLPAILGADDDKARSGYYRLVEGVWKSGLLESAYSKKIEDVEHAAELFSDTHTAMILMEYGNPTYIERCFLSMQNFRDVWTDINPYGHRHFKSCYFSASQVIESAPRAVDVPMNARATLPGLWAAWYNQNPTLIELFSQWGKAWVEDALRSDKGKPSGVLPAAVRFDNDEIGGYSENWYEPKLGWQYYDWIHLGAIMEMYNQLLGMYLITGDPQFMQPIKETFAIAAQDFSNNEQEISQKGTNFWVNRILTGKIFDPQSFRNYFTILLSRTKVLTASGEFDEYLKSHGEDYAKYLITNNKSYISSGCDRIIEDLKYNYPLRTSEVKFTDRVYVTYADHLYAMYTGGIGYGGEYPGAAVTWQNTGKDVAILVARGDARRVKILIYNFAEQKKVSARFWRLEPGKYEIQSGIDENYDDEIDSAGQIKFYDVVERGEKFEFELPSKQLFISELSQIKPDQTTYFPRVDLALAENDITFSNDSPLAGDIIYISAKVHNIGNLPAQDVMVELYIDDIKVKSKNIEYIDAPNDLYPRWEIVTFPWDTIQGSHEARVVVKSNAKEISRYNNSAKLAFNVL